MTTFLLLWNPTKWNWPEFEEGVVAEHLSHGQSYNEPWTTGSRSTGIHPGDRVFLLKTGPQPRSIVAAGTASSDIYPAPHWQNENLVPQLDVRWTEVADPTGGLPYAALRDVAGSLPNLVVDSGVELDESTAENIEFQWKSHVTAGGLGPSVIFRGRAITHQTILQVLGEYDLLGHYGFLRKHRMGTSEAWMEYAGRTYDAKAVLGAAVGMNPGQFAGGETTAKPLHRLGFDVLESNSGDPADGPGQQRPLFHARDANAGTAGPVRCPDPDGADRGLRIHRQLENWLAAQVAARGLAPLGAAPTDPLFDLAWTEANKLTVVEVKSLTAETETDQLRYGLAQVLEYADLLGGPSRVRPALFVEREPTAPHWASLCRRLGVELWWPGSFPGSENPGE